MKICIFERSNEKNHFSKTKIYFHQKNYTTIIRTYWATKYESRGENEFWATCHNVSNLFNGCWHPLLSSAQIILIFAKKQILEKKNHIKRKSTRKKSIEILQLARRYQMAAAESWPLVGSWPCHQRHRGNSGSAPLCFGLESGTPNRDKERNYIFCSRFLYTMGLPFINYYAVEMESSHNLTVT